MYSKICETSKQEMLSGAPYHFCSMLEIFHTMVLCLELSNVIHMDQIYFRSPCEYLPCLEKTSLAFRRTIILLYRRKKTIPCSTALYDKSIGICKQIYWYNFFAITMNNTFFYHFQLNTFFVLFAIYCNGIHIFLCLN